MSESTQSAGTLVRREDLGTDDAALFEFWLGQDRIAAKEEEKWVSRGHKVVRRYRDERDNRGNVHRFNILWSNVQTLLPVLYARTPKADVQRRFLDQDDTGRLASLLLERSIAYSLEKRFDRVMKAAVQDRLLPGRGVARVLYVPHYGDKLPDAFDDEAAAPVDIDSAGDEKPSLREVVYEEAIIVYTYWGDYREGPARTWDEVPWLRYRAYMNRDALVKRFGKKGKQVSLDFTPKGAESGGKGSTPEDIFKKAEVWEVWDKEKMEVVWLAPGTPDLILDRVPDPLRLPDFFPSPDPLLSTTTTDKRIPVPDFAEYQDQADELDNLTARIDILTRALKVAGVYPGALKQELEVLINGNTENKLIPVKDWMAWSEKGGLEGFIQFMPIKQIAETIIQLYAAREKTKDLLYEITGIGDIMRGATNPNETMGAQQLKANFSTRRIVPQQRDVAQFATELIRLTAAVIAEHFQPQTMSLITGYPQLAPVPPVPPQPMQFLPPQFGHNGGPPMAAGDPSGMMAPGQAPGQMPPPAQPNPAFAQWQQAARAAQQVQQANAQKQAQFDAACKLIKDDGVRGFKLEIEADSTIAPDEQAEQGSRVMFLKEIIPLLEQIAPMAQGNPTMAKLAGEVGMFVIRGFRVARTLEEAFEAAFAALGQMPPPQPKGPTGQQQNPAIEQAKIQADVANTHAQTQADIQDTNTKAMIAQATLAQKNQQAEMQAQTARERLEVETQHDQAGLALEAEKIRSTERVQNARVTASEARGAGGLT